MTVSASLPSSGLMTNALKFMQNYQLNIQNESSGSQKSSTPRQKGLTKLDHLDSKLSSQNHDRSVRLEKRQQEIQPIVKAKKELGELDQPNVKKKLHWKTLRKIQLEEQLKLAKDPYESIKIKKNQDNHENVECDICLETENSEDDELLICDLCLVGVHQNCGAIGHQNYNFQPKIYQISYTNCYGAPIIGIKVGDEWFCNRCNYLKEKKDIKCSDIKCFMCPDLKGAIKKVSKQHGKDLWAHMICINWMPEIWFKDEHKKNKIGGAMPQTRFEVNCATCKDKSGAVIQCDYKNCAKSWHVRCAVGEGKIKDWTDMREEFESEQEEDWVIPIFCDEHERKGKRAYSKQGLQTNEIQLILSPKSNCVEGLQGLQSKKWFNDKKPNNQKQLKEFKPINEDQQNNQLKPKPMKIVKIIKDTNERSYKSSIRSEDQEEQPKQKKFTPTPKQQAYYSHNYQKQKNNKKTFFIENEKKYVQSFYRVNQFDRLKQGKLQRLKREKENQQKNSALPSKQKEQKPKQPRDSVSSYHSPSIPPPEEVKIIKQSPLKTSTRLLKVPETQPPERPPSFKDSLNKLKAMQESQARDRLNKVQLPLKRPRPTENSIEQPIDPALMKKLIMQNIMIRKLTNANVLSEGRNDPIM